MAEPAAMSGKTVVITGASTGIGAAAARQLAALGAEVVVVGRNPAKTAAVATDVGGTGLTADYTRLDDVRRLAADLLERCPRIDVLANNAGGLWPRREVTADGHEQTFQVNHLATCLLTWLLADRLRASSARVITTSSSAHKQGRLDPELSDLDSERSYRASRVYGTTKLENILFTRELARRWAGTGVRCAAYHPGVVATEFARDAALPGLLYRSPLKRLIRTPDKGADTLTWLASTDGWVDGGYYQDRKTGGLSALAHDDALAARLWERTEELVGVSG